jgi:hypothetical protein
VTYKAFWHSYVAEHQHPLNRRLHFVGTGLAIACLAWAWADGNPWPVLGGPVFGYAFAWAGHFFVEKNRPATFAHPFWSLVADVQMFGFMCLGRMEREVRRMSLLGT